MPFRDWSSRECSCCQLVQESYLLAVVLPKCLTPVWKSAHVLRDNSIAFGQIKATWRLQETWGRTRHCGGLLVRGPDSHVPTLISRGHPLVPLPWNWCSMETLYNPRRGEWEESRASGCQTGKESFLFLLCNPCLFEMLLSKISAHAFPLTLAVVLKMT